MITPTSRFFVGILESRIVYADRTFDNDERVKSVDRYATLDYATLELKEEKPIPQELKQLTEKHAKSIRVMKGQKFYVNSTRTSWVILGSKLIEEEKQRQQAEQ